MKITIDYEMKKWDMADVKVMAAFTKKDGTGIQQSWSQKDLIGEFAMIKAGKNYNGEAGSNFSFTALSGETIILIGMGEKSKAKAEEIRKSVATAFKAIAGKKYSSVIFDAVSFNCISKLPEAVALIHESISMTSYSFDKYLGKKTEHIFKEVVLFISEKKSKITIAKAVQESAHTTESINIARDFMNEVPNVLHSVEYAKRIEKDVKANLKGVKVKILGKAELKKERMGLFLSVNSGSAHDPRLVHLTYTPKKVTKNTKHYALVGKGLTFDSGGYSLKPSASIMTMKYDMGGSATVYGAFRAAVLNNSNHKITLILGMTDNAINEKATMPDSVVTARSGTTVEILNTDAEGRLVLADCIDYACDLKPDYLVDAATLTGACLVALGTEVCALLSNDDKFAGKIKTSAKASDEYVWQMPIIPEWRKAIKSNIADLKNISQTKGAGTATAAAFLESFVHEGISWVHLDIAGICTDQKHLPYCSSKGASGLIVRTLHHLLIHGK